jgi:very-short-patch-repair endonuclease
VDDEIGVRLFSGILIRVEWHAIARRQGGVIGRLQLIAGGLSHDTIDGLLRRGRLERTHIRGVYCVPGAPDHPQAVGWIAVLTTRSPLSYRSGAKVWDVPVLPDGLIHITRFDRRRLDWPEGVRVHRVLLDPAAVTDRKGLLVTTRTETLLDCLGSLPIGQAQTLADRAKQQEWLSGSDIERRLTTQSGRWGNRQLRRLLASFTDDAHSEAERRLHNILRRAGVTGWRANVPVTAGGARYVIDVAFLNRRLAIEIDGYASHSSVEAFQRDRIKSARLTAAGWTVLRFTWWDLVERPEYVIATITQLLAA